MQLSWTALSLLTCAPHLEPRYHTGAHCCTNEELVGSSRALTIHMCNLKKNGEIMRTQQCM